MKLRRLELVVVHSDPAAIENLAREVLDHANRLGPDTLIDLHICPLEEQPEKPDVPVPSKKEIEDR